MEIFNIHIFEFLLIAGLALVVFGPERLPEVGRFVGKQVARFLAWQQQSPELKMITDVRSEFEREIASLRDELVRTRKQLDLSQDAELKSLRDELRPMLNLRDPQSAKAAAPQAEPKAAAQPRTWDPPAEDPLPIEDVADLASEATDATDILPEAADAAADAADLAPDVADVFPETDPDIAPEVAELFDVVPPGPTGTVPAATRPNRLAATAPTNVLDRPDERLAALKTRRATLDAHPLDEGAPATAPLNGLAAPPAEAPPSAEELRLLMRRLEALSADVQALIGGLQARGILGEGWEPESAVDEQEA